MNILITGTSRGLGLYFAESFLSEKCRVFGCSLKGESGISHDQYEHFMVDIRDERQVKDMMLSIRKSVKTLDVLINNAGVASMNHIITTPLETARKILEVNTLGTFLVTREAAKLIKKSAAGRIVNFSTVATPLNLEGEAVYASSKSAVETFTKISAKELAPYGITVNAIGPTPINTDLIRGIPEDKIKLLLNKQTIQRMGTEEDVLNVVNFFISPKSNFITGQVVYLGGVS